jgi:signal transduction histidine kinase
MQFMLIIWQREEGCDYMIGCGIMVKEMQADNENAAHAMARTIMAEMVHSECHIKRAALVASCHVLDIAVGGINAIADKDLEDEATEIAERAEYERLHAKFGK